MSMNVNNNSNFCMGATLGVVGMNAYFLPVTKDRFVRNAYNIHKEIAEDKIELLNKSAEELSKNKLSSESKIFLKGIYKLIFEEEITQQRLNQYLSKLVSNSDDKILRRLTKGVYRFADPRMSSYIRLVQSDMYSDKEEEIYVGRKIEFA